jgi:hypothetical protein
VLDTCLGGLSIRDPELARAAEIVASHLGATDRGDALWGLAGRLWAELGDPAAVAMALSRRQR